MGNLRLSITSKFGALTVFFFLLFSLLGRFLLPFGDEPDFVVVANQLISDEHQWWTPYYWCSALLKKFIISSNCIVDATPMSLWANINSSSCSESIEQILMRFLLGAFVAFPLLLALIFRRPFAILMAAIGIKLSYHEWNQRLNALGLSLILPGVTYYLGVLTEEQFTLVLSLFIFLFWGNWVVVSLLMFLISIVDLGNSVIVITFVCFSLLSISLKKLLGFRASFLTQIIIVFSAYIVGYMLLTYIQMLPLLAGKAVSMLSKSESGSFAEKYPALLRPAITFMTAVFTTPSGVKVVIAHLILGAGFIVSLRKVIAAYFARKHLSSTCKDESYLLFQNEIILASSSLTTILFFVFLFPDYANGKYYVFLVPFVIMPILSVSSKYSVLYVFILSATLVSLNLILYRL